MKYKLVKIKKIEKKHYNGKVYDLTVSNTHSYNINGIAVHNSVCETRTETGVHMPTLQSVIDCAKVQKTSLIIADGGIRIPSDMCKALVGGADAVMGGKIFAGYKETPGDVLKLEGKLHKIYRGAASYSVQQLTKNEKPQYSEGNETLVSYIDESVAKVLKRFKAGLQSSMSYANAKNLQEYRKNTSIEKL